MKTAFFISCIMMSIQLAAQSNNQPPCTAPESNQFDFWVGDWTIIYSDTMHATNHVEKMMSGCTVQENFSDLHNNYMGKSWSVYNTNYKLWQQTWVDNQGGYIALTGGMQGDSMVLITAERTVPVKISSTGKLMNRMVYYNITKDAFDWDWESSTDGGRTWKSNWQLHYVRK
jgi:hypothetical protein